MTKLSRKSNKNSNKEFTIEEVVLYKGEGIIGGDYMKAEKKRKANLKKNKDNRETPSHVEIKGDGYPYYRFNFNNRNEKLIARQGTFFMKTDNVTFRSRMASGFKKAFARYMSGENFFINEYKLKEDVKQKDSEYVLLTIDNPGQLLVKKILPGESFYVSPRNFVACSRNLKISAKLQVRRIVSESPSILITSFINETDRPGYVYIQAYGSMEEKLIKKGDKIQIDNSHLLCYDKHSSVKISKISNFRGLLFGGEGLTYKITPKGNSDCSVFIQTHAFDKFAQNICSKCSFFTKSSSVSSQSMDGSDTEI
jgi:uncharacterized protein (AIM24 family)